jgi:hypothetical protein
MRSKPRIQDAKAAAGGAEIRIVGFVLMISTAALPQSVSSPPNCPINTATHCESVFNSSSYRWSLIKNHGVLGDLGVPGTNKILHFASCPSGLRPGAFVYISGKGTEPESPPITDVSCAAGTRGTITITTNNRHRRNWQVSTSTDGIQEAVNALGSGGGTVMIPSGTWTVHSRITLPSNVLLQGTGLNKSTLEIPLNEFIEAPPWQFGLNPGAAVIVGLPGASHIGVTRLSILFGKQARPPNGSYGIIFVNTRDSTIDGVAVRNGPILTHGNTFLPIGVLGLSENNLVQNSVVYNQACTISSEGAGGFIASGKGNRFLHNYVSNGCNSAYVTQGVDTLFEANIFDLAGSSMVADAQAFANDNGSDARFVNNICIGNGVAPACFTAVTDDRSSDTVDSSYAGNMAWNCSEAYQFQSTVAKTRGIKIQGGEIVNCAIPVSVLGIVHYVSIEGVPGVRGVHSEHLYAITAHSGVNDDIALDDADAVWLSSATADFSVTGFKGGWEGREVEVVNATDRQATIRANYGGFDEGNRICVPDGTDIVLPSRDSSLVLRYSGEAHCWVAARAK